jgi:diadenylate cyclase
MIGEKEKTFVDYLRLVSPGSPLRSVIDDLVRSELGALIVFDSPQLQAENLFEGGFRMNSRFTPQKIFELCKMDGAIIISGDLKRILHANVLLIPSHTFFTAETGTRHKAAERIAKQANTFVIAVSERRKKTTLYHGSTKYYLKGAEEITSNLSPTIQVLEKHREVFESYLTELNLMEMSDLVSTREVCKVIQKAEMILKTVESVKRNFIELGKEGTLLNLRCRELLKGIEETENEILRDYATLPLKKSKTILSNMTFEGIMDLDPIARLIMEKSLETPVSPRGYRFLSRTTLLDKEVSLIVKELGDMKHLLSSSPADLEPILKNRASAVFEEIRSLREQILSGRVIN